MALSVEGIFLILLCSLGAMAVAAREWDGKIVMPTEEGSKDPQPTEDGQRWAVLVAGSSGYGNYRHQVCELNLNLICHVTCGILMYVRGELRIVLACLPALVVLRCNATLESSFWNACASLVPLLFDVHEVGKCSNLYSCEECHE